MITLSIIIPVYNNWAFTDACLKSIFSFSGFEQDEFEVIVADDDSEDGTFDKIKTFLLRYPNLKYKKNPKNLGFAQTCNNGAKAASGEFLVFLNNDTLVTPGWDRALYQTIRQDEEIWAVGAKCVYPDGTLQHAGVPFPEFYDRSLGHIYKGMPADFPLADYEKDFQCVTGACLMIRKADFRELNGFDTAYRNGFEDVDLCLRIHEKGKRIVYQPACTIVHYESKSDGRFDAMDNNKAVLLERWKGKIMPDEMDHYRADLGHALAQGHVRSLVNFMDEGTAGRLNVFGSCNRTPDGTLEILPGYRPVRLGIEVTDELKAKPLLVSGELQSDQHGILQLSYLTHQELFYSDQRTLVNRFFAGRNFFAFYLDPTFLTGEIILSFASYKARITLHESGIYSCGTPRTDAPSMAVLCHLHEKEDYLLTLLDMLAKVQYQGTRFHLLITFDKIKTPVVPAELPPNVVLTVKKSRHAGLPALYNSYLAGCGCKAAVAISDGVAMTPVRFMRLIELLYANPEVGVIHGDTRGLLGYEDQMPFQKTIFQKASLRQMKDIPVAFRVAAWDWIKGFDPAFSYYFNLDLATRIISTGNWKGYQLEGIRARSFVDFSGYPAEFKHTLEDFRELYFARHSKYLIQKGQAMANERDRILRKYFQKLSRKTSKNPHNTLLGSLKVHFMHFIGRFTGK